MNNNNDSLSGTIAVGVGWGIIMSLIILAIFRAVGYRLWSPAFAAVTVITVFLPHCMNFTKKYGIRTNTVNFISTVVSLLVCLLYAHAAAATADTQTELLSVFAFPHCVSLLCSLIYAFIAGRIC